ncbi:TrkH family potassium uptake protein [Solwaraspora sp. WMMD406]|uniref:TrkH family potassium uptake protein n=1 Tax=Solwaraspora sp. WMMD406 TaxID=3016095 RepID=UPI0024169DA2|nr:TrkH family potassium uptake protein [Solwaraspora sp. WMMD406]MDG4764307.1 TrkH family potassium uptake protein [Solwaraspora sp. WMMD406]
MPDRLPDGGNRPTTGPTPGRGEAANRRSGRPGSPGRSGRPGRRWRVPMWRRGADRFQHPAQVIAGAFAVAVLTGTALLMLPVASRDGQSASLVDAMFTATSAVCVTGLVVVDTAGYWSVFGQLVILALIQVGGLGIMTLATLLTVLLSRRLGLRARFLAQAETKSLSMRDVRRVVRNIVLFSLASEFVVAVVLTVRFALRYDYPLAQAAYHGLFHAISAFNNAGFALYTDSLVRFVADPWIMISVSVAVIVGGLGFPVVFELLRSWRRPRTWSVLTRITVVLTVSLLILGTVLFTIVEFRNPGTFGELAAPEKLLAGFFASVMTRTAGFNSVDIGAMRPESLLLSDILMFIGGGSAGTAGGVKVTTVGLLAFVLWAEMRGETQVNIGARRVPESNQRQALAVVLLALGAVAVATFALLAMTRYSLDQVLFEVISAFATVGLSTGITAGLPPAADVLLILLMFMGRIGPLTVASALALRERGRRYELPEERTIVG